MNQYHRVCPSNVVRWEYEPQRDLLTLVSNATHSAYRYMYDAAGQRVSKNDERYGYNARGELILATNIVDGTVFMYAYDAIGNRLSSCEFGTNAVYTANNLNQYTEIVRGGVAEHPQFDADGNQTDITTGTGRWLVEYNGENRPVRWTRPADGKTMEMSYDRMGRRVKSGEETFVYDGYLNIGTTIWDPTEPVATRPLVWLGEDAPAYYFHDGNKNVMSSVGSILRYCSYAPFGTAMNGMLEDVNPWGFSSEFTDSILDMVYYNYRNYNVHEGRWTGRDLVYELGGVNLYSFCFNGFKEMDILGLTCMPGTYNVLSIVIDSKPSANGIVYNPGFFAIGDDLMSSLSAFDNFYSGTSLMTGRALERLISFLDSAVGNTIPSDDGAVARIKQLYERLKNGLVDVYGIMEYEICICKDGKSQFVKADKPITEEEVQLDSSDARSLREAYHKVLGRMSLQLRNIVRQGGNR